MAHARTDTYTALVDLSHGAHGRIPAGDPVPAPAQLPAAPATVDRYFSHDRRVWRVQLEVGSQSGELEARKVKGHTPATAPATIDGHFSHAGRVWRVVSAPKGSLRLRARKVKEAVTTATSEPDAALRGRRVARAPKTRRRNPDSRPRWPPIDNRISE